jgi:Uma2 family endonuclease
MTVGARHLHRYSYSDYLRLEEDSPVRHEFLDGEIFAMAGGTPEHAALAMAVATAFGRHLENGECRVFGSDLRVRVLETGLATYPDVTVVCGPTVRDPESRMTVLNPSVVVEVTSDSSEEYDRGEKLDSYLRIPSLGAYLVVSHRRPSFDLWQRDAQRTWQRNSAGPGDALVIEAIGCTLSVNATFGKILTGV